MFQEIGAVRGNRTTSTVLVEVVDDLNALDSRFILLTGLLLEDPPAHLKVLDKPFSLDQLARVCRLEQAGSVQSGG